METQVWIRAGFCGNLHRFSCGGSLEAPQSHVLSELHPSITPYQEAGDKSQLELP